MPKQPATPDLQEYLSSRALLSSIEIYRFPKRVAALESSKGDA